MLYLAGFTGQHFAAADSFLRAEAKPGGEGRGVAKPADIRADLGKDDLRVAALTPGMSVRIRDAVMLEIKLILCPVDFSEFSIRAYHYALSLAEHYRAKVVVQNIVEIWRYPYADYVPRRETIRSSAERCAKAARRNCGNS